MGRQDVIDVAAAEEGFTENPAGSNRTKYGEWYGLNGVPWCAIFVSWVFDRAGLPLGTIDTAKGYQYCPSAYNFWKRTNRITTTPQPGDIILYDWHGDGRCDHTGIFVGWIKQGESFRAWEGNTAFRDDSNGGIVMLRDRKIGSVKAFVNPTVYGEAVSVHDDNLKLNDRGAEVTQIQKWLHDLDYDIVVDGHFGPRTQRVVKAFQHDHGLQPTGIVDDICRGAIEAALSRPKVSDEKLVTGSYLRKGNAGAAVVVLQHALNKNGAKPALEVDGVFGNATLAALKKFQQKNKQKSDGIAGPATWKALGVRLV